MVNSSSFDAAGSEGESVNSEFTQLEQQAVGACATEASFTAVVPATEAVQITSLLDLQSVKTPSTPKTSLQCSVPLEKVKNVLELYSNKLILESYLKQTNPDSVQKPTAKRLLCLFCDRTFTSNNLRQKHVDRCHSSGQTRRTSSRTPSHNQSTTACYFCNKLNHTDHTLKQLLEHLVQEHSNRYFACLSCQERFNSVLALRDHNKLVHGLNETAESKSDDMCKTLTRSCSVNSDESSKSDNVLPAAANECSSPNNPSSLSKKSSSDHDENSPRAPVDFPTDLEASISENIISQDEATKEKTSLEEIEDISLAKRSKNITVKTKKNQINNKKITVKSTKNGVRNNGRTTRATVKQLNNFNKNRKNKVKTEEEPVVQTRIKKPENNPSSVFSLVNAYIYKYEKIYDHASDSIKDANSVQFNAVFDKEFYSRTVYNIRDNLLHHLDGKLNKNIESESRISNFEHSEPETKAANEVLDNFGCDLTLNAVTPVATLLGSSQYGEDFDAQIEYAAKASQKKAKKVAVVKYKFPNKKYNSLFHQKDAHSDMTCLDMWTQLTVKKRQQKLNEEHLSGFDAKQKVDELNGILDKRGPFEDLLLEANTAQFLELRKKTVKDDFIPEEISKDVYIVLENLLNLVDTNETKNEVAEVETTVEPELQTNLEIPHYLQLERTSTNKTKIDPTDTISLICSAQDETESQSNRVELTGEWTRPRIYICATCSLKLPNLKSLDDHKNVSHPHIWSSHYEFVGNKAQVYRHLSIPGLGKVGAVECLPVNRLWQRSDARVCSKCTKQCHNLGELHKHILECGGDWTWMLARKKCKYRPYGARSRRRRQRGYKRSCNPEVREHKPKNKPIFIGPRPKPSKPSDAETIERMLANLPPKRNRKMVSMRDGIQRPRKPYKQKLVNQHSSLDMSPKTANNKTHYKNNSPQITKQTLRNTLKRKISVNNLKKQNTNDPQTENINTSLKLRNRINKNDKKEIEDTVNVTNELIGTKAKIRNKRMISRILGSKIFDSNSALVTRRKLVKAITQNNLIRKTRLRSKVQQQISPQNEEVTEDKKADKKNKSNSKSLTLTKAPKKIRNETDSKEKIDTISAVIDQVVRQSVQEKTEDKLEEKPRKTRRSSSLKKINKDDEIQITDSKEVSNVEEIKIIEPVKKKENKFKKILVQNVKSFRKSFKKSNGNKKDGITSKLIRSLSMRSSKASKTKTVAKNELKKTAEDENNDINIESSKQVDSEMNDTDNNDSLPTTIKKTLPSDQIQNTSISENVTKTENLSELKNTLEKHNEVIDNKIPCDKINSNCTNPLNKFKNKIKRSGKGLNDCIAMLKCKLEQKYSTCEASLVDKSNLFILNSSEMNKSSQIIIQDENKNQSLGCHEITKEIVTENEIINSENLTENDEIPKNESKNLDTSILETLETKIDVKQDLLTSEMTTVETQTIEQDISATDYISSEIQTNFQLNYVLNATLKNCLMECVKMKIENQNVPNLNSKSNSFKDRKIGSVRKRKSSKISKNIVEKHIPNVPVLLNTAFCEKVDVSSTKTTLDVSDDDIPLTKKKRNIKNQIAFTPLILNDQDSCIPQISLQERIEQNISLDNSVNNKTQEEKVDTNIDINNTVIKTKENTETNIVVNNEVIKTKEYTETDIVVNNAVIKTKENIETDIIVNNNVTIERNEKTEGDVSSITIETKEKAEVDIIVNNVTNKIESEKTIALNEDICKTNTEEIIKVDKLENINKNVETILKEPIINKETNENLLPISQQIMALEEEPFETYLVNKTLTEANTEPSTPKNIFQNNSSTENSEFLNQNDDIESGKENSEENSFCQKNKKHKKNAKKAKSKRKSRSKINHISLQQENNILDVKNDEILSNNFKDNLQNVFENESEFVIMENKIIEESTIQNSTMIEKSLTQSDSEDELPLALLIKNKRTSDDTILNEEDLQESDLVNINLQSVTEIIEDNLNLEDKQNISIVDNLINKEDYLNEFELKNDKFEIDDLDKNIIENLQMIETNDRQIVTSNNIELSTIENEETDIQKTVYNENVVENELNNDQDPKSLNPVDKSIEFMDPQTPIVKQNTDASFITTPDLANESLVIKIKRNLKIKIRKPKKTRRRVIPKELSKNNVKRKEEEDINLTVICDICNKTFKRKENLVSHKKTLTHIAKLSEIEAKESLARKMNEIDENNETTTEKNEQTEDLLDDVAQNGENILKNGNIKETVEMKTVFKEILQNENKEIIEEIDNKLIEEKQEEIKEVEQFENSFKIQENLDEDLPNLNNIEFNTELDENEETKEIEETCTQIELNQTDFNEDFLEINKNLSESREIINIDESSIDSQPQLTIEDGDFEENAEAEIVPPIEEIINLQSKSSDKNLLPGIMNNNGNLKLVDLISEVLEKPENDLNISEVEYIPENLIKSPNNCDSNETISEPKRYKSLGERKSFDSDNFNLKPNEETATENYKNSMVSVNNGLLSKQLSLLENIIEETAPNLNYIEDSLSLSSSQFDEPAIEQNEQKYSNLNDPEIKFSHSSSILSNFIKPNNFNNFENIAFAKPAKQFEEMSNKNKDSKDNTKRKILNRDEELFLECCSLLKSGSEKSARNISSNNFSKSNDAGWIIQKQSNSQQFIQRDSYSWLAQSSRVDTPIGEPFVSNDWSNSNSAISSEWLTQKAPSPDRPTASNTLDKKSNNTSGETKYSEIHFEDISIDSSLDTSKTLMPIDTSNSENIPLDFHHVDFSNKNKIIGAKTVNEIITNDSTQQPFIEINDSTTNTESNEEFISEQVNENNEVLKIDEKFDSDLKKRVVSAFSGLMAKSLTNRLNAVVHKSKKSRGKRELSSSIQASITDYTVPIKKNKLNSTDSDSNDCPKKLITKGAMKVFEGLKVSIPTQDINLKEVLNCTQKLKNGETEETEPIKNGKTKGNIEDTLEYTVEKKNGKIKKLLGRFGNKLGLRERKKKHRSKSKNLTNKISRDVYEFDESFDSLLNSDKLSLFRNNQEDKTPKIISSETFEHQNHLESETISQKWNFESESDTDRYYDSMSFEDLSSSSESTEQSNNIISRMKLAPKRSSEKTKENQKKCMIMGRIFKNASKPKLEDKIPEIRDISSEENSKIVENFLGSCSSVDNIENINNQVDLSAVANNHDASSKKMSKLDMDLLFDKLLEEEKKNSEINIFPETETNNFDLSYEKNSLEKRKTKDGRSKPTTKPKKRHRHNSENSTSSDEFTLGRNSKSTKKHYKTPRKSSKPKKDSGFNLELEMKECIGVAGRKSQRKCTSGKQNVLIEFWSSDESSFEDLTRNLEKQTENETEINEKPVEIQENVQKPSIDIYEFDSELEENQNELEINLKLKEHEFISASKIKIPKRTAKQKHKNKKHLKNFDETDTEYETEIRKRLESKKRNSQPENCLAVTRKKRNAGDQLYYWSSSSDDEMEDLIEVKPIREDTEDDRPIQHGWIVGDSPKKLVTMLAQAKGKKIDGESVKEQGKKNRVTL